MTPFEIIAAPLTLYLAPVGTAFPLLNAAPAVAWTKIGTNGDRSYEEGGVTVAHKQSVNTTRTARSVGPVKAFRASEDMTITLTLLDLTLEQYAFVLGQVQPTATAAATGTPGFKKLGMSRGGTVATYAALARGVSAYDESMIAQYELPRCFISGSPSLVYDKAKPVGLQIELTALEDMAASVETERFGRLLMQHQAAL